MKKNIYILILLNCFSVINSAQEKADAKSLPLVKHKTPPVVPVEMAEFFVGELEG